MKKTNKNHWVNGHQVRGKNFHTINFSILNFGVMISGYGIPTKISFYKLIPNHKCKTVQDCFDVDVMGILN